MHRWRIPALFVLFMFLVASEVSADTGSDFRRWGVGWGGLLNSGTYTAPAVRYRTPGGWNITVAARFSTDDSSGLDDGIYYYGDSWSTRDSEWRDFAVELGRSIHLQHGLEATPVLRYVYSYSRREGESGQLRVYEDPFNWQRDYSSFVDRTERTWYEIGLRPRYWILPRLSVETGAFLSFSRTFERWSAFERTERYNEETEEQERFRRDRANAWGWNLPTPSVNMSVILMFYF